jgi:GT2 family glycosyltransferase
LARWLSQPLVSCEEAILALISAVIPTFNQQALLDRTIASIEGADVILVVDDGSSEPVRAQARILRLERNRGFAHAVNRGVEAARGDWIAILNNDIVLEPGYLAQLTASGAPYACGLMLRESDPAIADGAWDLLTPGGLAYRVADGRPASWFRTARTIQFAPFTAIVIRRDVWQRVGPLDERFITYYEDVDWCLRAGIAGFRGWFDPAARALHRGSATLGAWREETVRLLARNQVLLISKHFPPGWVWNYGCSTFFGQALWGLSAWRRGLGRPWRRGKREGWQLWLQRQPAASPPGRVVPESAIFSESIQELRSIAPNWFWKLNAWIS